MTNTISLTFDEDDHDLNNLSDLPYDMLKKLFFKYTNNTLNDQFISIYHRDLILNISVDRTFKNEEFFLIHTYYNVYEEDENSHLELNYYHPKNIDIELPYQFTLRDFFTCIKINT